MRTDLSNQWQIRACVFFLFVNIVVAHTTGSSSLAAQCDMSPSQLHLSPPLSLYHSLIGSDSVEEWASSLISVCI